MKLTQKSPLGNTGLLLPQVVYGTSYLGNLYKELPFDDKLALMRKWFECTEKPVVIDSAGKYGAGLALEVIGKGLAVLDIDPEDIVISNKLGWYRIPLTADEPTFEPGAWVGLEHDCEQRFGYEGIMECFQQGNELLGGKYNSEVVSIHDPDEYLLTAGDPVERKKRFTEILESYRALFDLKQEGKVKAVGIGSKDWTIISELYQQVPFDWVMFANSFTLYSHPADLLNFMDLLYNDGVGIVNSALFHGGFLTGGQQFDYRAVDPDSEQGLILFKWRNAFHNLCRQHEISPEDACIHFGYSHPAIASIALNTSKPEKMIKNAEMLSRSIPGAFWDAMKREEIIDPNFPYL
jgi:D-threo-aldose 1-dehydrogenase